MDNKTKIIALLKHDYNYFTRYAISLTKNSHDAQDLFQQTWLKAVEKHDKLANDSNIKGWIVCIMRNTFINEYNKTKKEATNKNSYMQLINRLSTNTIEEELNTKEYVKAIKNLNPRLRRAFSLYIAGYKYTEIAEIQKTTLGTIKNRIFHARQILKKQLVQNI